MDNTITFKVYGRYALFSDPITRCGGEKFSYSVPTYSSLKGICESIFWKPTIIWFVDSVRILNQIVYEPKGVRTINYKTGQTDLSTYTYLKDVAYEVKAHFEWNKNRQNLEKDYNTKKYSEMIRRYLFAGGRRDIFLGTRECQAFIEPIIYGESESFYKDKEQIDFGIMFHSFEYPDEVEDFIFKERLSHIVMKRGEIIFLPPSKCNKRFITKQKRTVKEFKKNANYKSLEDKGEDF